MQRLPRRGRRHLPAARLRQRRLLAAAPRPRVRRRRRRARLAHARRPLPRPRAVRLRAVLRAAPAAPIAVAGWPGTDAPVRPRLLLPPGATELIRAVAAAGGQPGLFDSAFERERVRHRRDARDRHAARALSAGAALRPVQRHRADVAGGRRALRLRRRPRPDGRAARVRRAGRPAHARGVAAVRAARHRRPAARSSHGGRGGRARGGLRRARGSCSRTSPTSSTRSRRSPRRPRAYAGPIEIARTGAVYTV